MNEIREGAIGKLISMLNLNPNKSTEILIEEYGFNVTEINKAREIVNASLMTPEKEKKIKETKIALVESYEMLIDRFKYYVDSCEKNYHIPAIWSIGTYSHSQFPAFPYLFFNATKGSAKTRFLKLLAYVCAGGDGKVLSNVTEAVIFRHPPNQIMCIDEVEQLNSKEYQTRRELLQSAYKKGMKVQRMKKVKLDGQEKQVVETFEPYFPVALANISGMDEIIADRAIPLILEKSNKPEFTKKVEDFENDPILNRIKANLNVVNVVNVVNFVPGSMYIEWNDYIHDKYITTLTTDTTITTLNYITTQTKERERLFNLIDNLNIQGRHLELLFPLILMSDFLIDDRIMQKTLEFGKEIFGEKQNEEYIDSRDISLYDYISRIDNDRFISIKQLTSEFRLFCGDSEEEVHWLNEKWMGRALRRLNLVKQKKRITQGIEIILDLNKAKEKIKMFK